MLGGGAGHIADMIARNKANQELRKHKSRFRKDFFVHDPDYKIRNITKLDLNDKPLSSLRREHLKKLTLKERRQEIKKLMTVLIVSLAAFATLLFLALKIIPFRLF